MTILPIEVHYGVPYAHHQSTAETHVKNFKRCFLKLLNDDENSTDSKDWDLLLPTITQSINRQIVLALGITRESLHFNMPSSFYPLAHLEKDVQSDLQDAFGTFHYDFYRRLVRERLKRISKLNRAKVPQYSEGQIVLVKSQIPEQSSLFKIPYKGPYRIKKLGPRNVDLVDLESGKEHTSYVEFLKPLSVREFKLVLSKTWDLHFNHKKRIRNEKPELILDKPDDPYSLGEISQIENQTTVQPTAENSSTGESDSESADYDPLEGTSTAYFSNTENKKPNFNPISLGKLFNKNDMDGLASLNNKIIENLKASAECGSGTALGSPGKPVFAHAGLAEPLQESALAFAKNQHENEIESEHSQASAAMPTSCLVCIDHNLVKGDVSQNVTFLEYKTDNVQLSTDMQSAFDSNERNEISENKLKKVGFRSFMTRFFDANK
mgnify:FL=1